MNGLMMYKDKKSELYDLMAKAIRNRKLLCNEKGQLKKENKRYKTAYKMLLDSILDLFSDICADQTTRFFYWPTANDPEQKAKEISALWLSVADQIFAAIKCGTYEDLCQIEEYYVKMATDIFCDKIRFFPANELKEEELAIPKAA